MFSLIAVKSPTIRVQFQGHPCQERLSPHLSSCQCTPGSLLSNRPRQHHEGEEADSCLPLGKSGKQRDGAESWIGFSSELPRMGGKAELAVVSKNLRISFQTPKLSSHFHFLINFFSEKLPWLKLPWIKELGLSK